jgi:hypothetical protein
MIDMMANRVRLFAQNVGGPTTSAPLTDGTPDAGALPTGGYSYFEFGLHKTFGLQNETLYFDDVALADHFIGCE